MQIFSPLKKEATQFVKTFLQENPNLMKKYVDTSITVLSFLLVPLDVFLRHLLIVQGLDPNEIPGRREAQQLQDDMTSFLYKIHDKEYDTDFDLSWAMKRFEETRKVLQDRELTEKQFKEFTDISNLDCVDVAKKNSFSRVESETTVPELFVIEANSDIIPSMQGLQVATATCITEEDLDNPSIDNDVKATKGVKTEKKKLNRTTSLTSKKQIQEKVMKATTIVNDMVACGLCESNSEAIQNQVNEILKFNDEAYESLKRLVRRHDILPKDVPAKTTRQISKRKVAKK